MSRITRTNQGGSVIVFIIVGIILTIGLIGTVYFVRQRGEVARKEQAIAAYDKEQADKKTAEEANKPDVVDTNDVENFGDNMAVVPSSATDLPVTGLGSSISELIGTGSMTVAMAGYLISRRNQKHSL